MRVKPSAKLCTAYPHRYQDDRRGWATWQDVNLWLVVWATGRYEDFWEDYYTDDELEEVDE